MTLSLVSLLASVMFFAASIACAYDQSYDRAVLFGALALVGSTLAMSAL